MKKPSTIGRTRLVVAAVVVAAAGVFASVGMAGFGTELVGLSHNTPTTDQYPTAKVTICHHTHSQKNPFVTITVSQNAVAAHVRNHGDTIGPCSEQPPAVPVVPAKNNSQKLLKAHKLKNKATKAKLRRHGKSKAKHESQGKSDSAKGVGHKPTTGPSTVHGKGQGNGQGNGKTKTHGPPADRGQGQGNGHGHDKSQNAHGQGHGQGNGDTHGNSGGGGNGNGNGKGH
jgi:hypothetical protein